MTKKEIAEIIESKAAEYGFEMAEHRLFWATNQTNKKEHLTMKNKTRFNLAELILAVIFFAATASAQKPNNIGMSEVLEITSIIDVPTTIVVNDAEIRWFRR